jgi:hypothetical protein
MENDYMLYSQRYSQRSRRKRPKADLGLFTNVEPDASIDVSFIVREILRTPDDYAPISNPELPPIGYNSFDSETAL